MRTAHLGSISHGTLRTEDLLGAFASELEDRVQCNADAWCSDSGRASRDALVALVWDAREVKDFDSDEAIGLVDELMDALEQFAPDYAYFGAHPGDGSDFGFWLIEDFQQQMGDDGTLVVDDLNAIPDDYRGLACVVNDHGNATLYTIDATDVRREVWSVV